MRKVALATLKVISLLLILLSFSTPSAYAADVFSCTTSSASQTYSSKSDIPADYHSGDTVKITITIGTQNWQSIASDFKVNLWLHGDGSGYNTGELTPTISGNTLSVQVPVDKIKPSSAWPVPAYDVVLRGNRSGSVGDLCKLEQVITLTDVSDAIIPPSCSSLKYSPNPLTATDKSVTVTFSLADIKDAHRYYIRIAEAASGTFKFSQNFTKNGELQDSMGFGGGTTNVSGSTVTYSVDFDPTKSGYIGLFPYPDASNPVCKVDLVYNPETGHTEEPPPKTLTKTPFQLCNQAEDAPKGAPADSCTPDKTTDYGRCCDCFKKTPPGVWTAVGCIPTSPQGIVQSILRIGLGMAGGVVVLSVLAGAFMLATSSGNPKQVEEAQQLISSAIIGLLFVVFSIIILQFIGVSILHLPGFGSSGTLPK